MERFTYIRQLRKTKMVQVAKSTKDFELFGDATQALLEVTENSKDEVILGRCAIYPKFGS